MPTYATLKLALRILALAAPLVALTAFTTASPETGSLAQATASNSSAEASAPATAADTPYYQWRRPKAADTLALAAPAAPPLPETGGRDRVLDWETGAGRR